MGAIEKIKAFIGARFLNSDTVLERQKAFFNIDEAKTVGIIFDAGNKEDKEAVKKHVTYLRDRKKKVKVMGFFNEKEVPALDESKLEYDFFCLKDINWYNKPTTSFIYNFINEQFDILLDLNISGHQPLKYIAVGSKAKCKVGKQAKGMEKIYDLIIETEPKTLKDFLNQIDIYLDKINK